jgi:hypothetical protein
MRPRAVTSTKIGLMIAAAAAAFAFTSPAHAGPFTASCTGSTSQLVCTFTAAPGELFIDSQAADINLTGTFSSATETFSGGSGAVTSSNITFNSTHPANVDGLGTFTLTDDLISGPGGNPTVSQIILTINGTGLALVPNGDQNIFAAHICNVSTGSACTNTFFTTPTGVPAPIVGAGLPGLVMACGGLIGLARRRQRRMVA